MQCALNTESAWYFLQTHRSVDVVDAFLYVQSLQIRLHKILDVQMLTSLVVALKSMGLIYEAREVFQSMIRAQGYLGSDLYLGAINF